MVYNNARHFMYIIEIILIFLSRTFAPWNASNMSRFGRPDVLLSLTCTNWITHSGFTFDDFGENLRLASSVRDPVKDEDIFIYAVMYAHMLVAFPEQLRELNFLPNDYCTTVAELADDFPIPFRPLNGEERTCERWIKSYGYKDNNLARNKDFAIRRAQNEDGVISLWAAGYGKYLAEHSNKDPILPRDFCNGIKAPDGLEIFMNLNVTTFSCPEWIGRSGYHLDDLATNVSIAHSFDRRFLNYTNHWTKMYTKHVRKVTGGCRACLGTLPKSPDQICSDRKLDSATQVKYFV